MPQKMDPLTRHALDIGIITCNNALNYGARLQAYALHQHLLSIGHNAYIIDYNPAYMQFSTRAWYMPKPRIKEWVKLLVRHRQRLSDIAKHDALERFSHSSTLLTDVVYRDVAQLRAVPPLADVYIAGSDQIWNPTMHNGNDPAYYLDFGPANAGRVSYAASFAIPALDEGIKDTISGRLRRFDSVSVREESAVEICRGLGIEAALVCDPVFLIDETKWSDVATDAATSDRYVLVYDFERSGELKRVAQRVARLRGLKIYSVSPYRLRYATRCYPDCAPETFLSLLRGASCVVSNSLHGSIFSMVFRKDFFVVYRADGLNVRMTDLLARYRLTDRAVSPADDDKTLCAPIDYDRVYQRLNLDIRHSKDFISASLNSFVERKCNAR